MRSFPQPLVISFFPTEPADEESASISVTQCAPKEAMLEITFHHFDFSLGLPLANLAHPSSPTPSYLPRCSTRSVDLFFLIMPTVDVPYIIIRLFFDRIT